MQLVFAPLLTLLLDLHYLEHRRREGALDVAQSLVLLNVKLDLFLELGVAVTAQSDLLVEPLWVFLHLTKLLLSLDIRDQEAKEWRQLFVRE